MTCEMTLLAEFTMQIGFFRNATTGSSCNRKKGTIRTAASDLRCLSAVGIDIVRSLRTLRYPKNAAHSVWQSLPSKKISRTKFHVDESFLSKSPSQSFAEQFGVCAGWHLHGKMCQNRPPCSQTAWRSAQNSGWPSIARNARVSACQGQDFITTPTC